MMTTYSTDEFDRAKAQMGRDLNAAITQSQDLLKAEAPRGDARTKFEEQPGSVPPSAAETSQPAVVKVRSAAAAADDYVRHSPWSAIGIAAAAGMLIGFLTGRR
jgi:ElaB/YqjD/DUF883 family membrane-anchored ribosome-binding protein